jgi:hypothetical protein
LPDLVAYVISNSKCAKIFHFFRFYLLKVVFCLHFIKMNESDCRLHEFPALEMNLKIKLFLSTFMKYYFIPLVLVF